MRRFDMYEMHSHERGRRRGPGGHGYGGHRARRGAVGEAILALLADRPMHGYEVINELEERSGGRWRPSPGAIYPALGKLEHAGLIAAAPSPEGDKRVYSITDEGRRRFAEAPAGDPPWERTGRRTELRREIAELAGQVRQIDRFGTPSQLERAREVLQGATRSLYQVLAESGTDASAGDSAD
ncbi:MAG TPA: PadR family transcriptional regulator [Ilumatobacteraceae bacterium]